MRRASYFPPLFDGGDIAQPYRRAVLIRDDKLAVFVGRLHLIVSRKRHRPFGAIQTAFRRVDVGAGNCGTDCFAGQTERGDSLSIQFYAYRRALPAGSVTSPTPETCEIFCATRVSTMSSTWVIGIAFEVTASVIIGGSAGLTLL